MVDSVNIIFSRSLELYRREHKYHFFFGDETTIGVFESLQHLVEENGQEYIGILELNQETLRVEFNSKSGLEIVQSSIDKAQKRHLYFKEITRCRLGPGKQNRMRPPELP